MSRQDFKIQIERIPEGRFVVLGHWEWDEIASSLEAFATEENLGELELDLGVMSVPQMDIAAFHNDAAAMRVSLVRSQEVHDNE